MFKPIETSKENTNQRSRHGMSQVGLSELRQRNVFHYWARGGEALPRVIRMTEPNFCVAKVGGKKKKSPSHGEGKLGAPP